MQGQPAQEAPASELHELLKEIKELKAGLLVDSVTHDNPTFEGPPWANQQAGMRLDIPTDDLEDSLEDLVARDTGLQYILSPQAEAQVAQSSRNTESERSSPRRAGSAAPGIGRGRNLGLQTTVAVSGTPGTPASSLPGRHGVAPPAPAAAGSVHRTPLASRGVTSAFPSGSTSAATPVASAESSVVALTPAAAVPSLTTPVTTTMRSKIGSRIARAGAAVAAGNTAASRTPVGIQSPALRSGSTVQLNAQSPSPAAGAFTHSAAPTGTLPVHGTTAGPAAFTASPRAQQTSTPALPRTAREKVAAAVGALGTIATGGRYSPRSIGKTGAPAGPSPASSTLGARSSTGSGGSSSTGSAAPATTTQTPGPSIRKRPPQGGTAAPSSTPARKVPGSAGLPGGTATRSVTTGTQSRTTATPSALGVAGKIPSRSVNSATASAHSGSAASSPPPSPQRKRTAVAAAGPSTGAAAKRPQHANLRPPAAAAAAGASVSGAVISTDELECETSHRSLTLPTAAIGPDMMAEESLEDLLADDPWLAASTKADASCGTGVFNAPGDSSPRLQRRTSDELLRPLADAMAEGTGNSDWMDEDTDAAMNLLMLGGTDDAELEAVMSPVAVAAAVAAAVTPGAASSPSTGSRHGAAAWIPNTTPSPRVLGGLLPESSATEILAAASLRASQEPIGSTVCKVRELLGMDGPSSQQEGIPELDSEELWRTTAADADKLFLQYGTNNLHNDTDEVFPATSTAAAVAAAVAVPREPSVPSSPAETPEETQAAERRAVLETATPNPLPLSHQGVPTARSPVPDATATLDGRDSWTASELAAAVGASHYDILETDDGFLSDVLAAEAAAAAAAVVCGPGSSLAAGAIVTGNVHPLDAAGNVSTSSARRMLLPSSSSSSFVLDATLAMEANMISRQLAGGPPSLRVHGGSEDAILECDELSSTTVTPQSVAPAATMTAMPSPECGVAENLYAAMDDAMEAVYQDEIASPAPLLATSDSDREDEGTAAEGYRTDAPMEGSKESGPAHVPPSAAASLNAAAPRTAAVVDMDLAFEGTSQDEADLGSVMAAADALQDADEALTAATATEVADAVMDMDQKQSAVMAENEAAAAAALESTFTVSPFAVAMPEAAAAIVGTPGKAVGMVGNAAEAWTELQETAAVAAPRTAEDVDMAAIDNDAPLDPEDVQLLDDDESKVAACGATTEDKPVFLGTGPAPDANEVMQHAAAAAVAAAAITAAETVTVPVAQTAAVSAHSCAAATTAAVKVGCDEQQEEVESEMQTPAVAVDDAAATAAGATDTLRDTQLSSLPGLPVVAAAATAAEGPQERTANVLEPVEDSRYAQPLLGGAVASETTALAKAAQGRKLQQVEGTPALMSGHSSAEMTTDLRGGAQSLLAATATRALPLVSTTSAATAAARGEVETEALQVGLDTPMDNANEAEEVAIPADAAQPTTAVTVLEAGPVEEPQLDGAGAPMDEVAAAVAAIQAAVPVDAQLLMAAAGAELSVEEEMVVDGCYGGVEEPVTAVAEGGVRPLLEAVMEGATGPAGELHESQGVSMDIAEEPEPATIEPRATQAVADSVEMAWEEIRARDLAQAGVVDALARAFPADVSGAAPDSHGMAAATTAAAAPSDCPLDVHGGDAVAEDEQPNDTAADVARSMPSPIVGSAKVSSHGFSQSAETEAVSAIADSEGEGARADSDRRFTDAELHTGSGGELDDQMYDAEEDGFEVGQTQTAFQEQLPPYPEFLTVPEHLIPNGIAAATTLGTEAVPMATVGPETDPSASAGMDHHVEGRSLMRVATETEAETPDLGTSTGGMIDIPFDRSARITLSTVNSHQLDDVDYGIDEDAELDTSAKRSGGPDDDEDGVSSDLRHKAPAGAGASLLAAAAASGAGTGSSAVQHTTGDGGVADANADDGSTTATARKRARLAPVGPATEEEIARSVSGSGLGLAEFYGSVALADVAREAASGAATSGSVAGKTSAYMQLDVANLIGAQAASVPMAGAETDSVERSDRGGPQTESSLDRSLELVSTTQGTCAIPESDADEVYNAASPTSTLSSAEAATMTEVSPTKQDACGETVPGGPMPATNEAELRGGMHEDGGYASRPELVTATPASTWLAPQGAAIAMSQPFPAGTSRISIGVTDEAVLQTPAVISSRTAALPISPRNAGWRSAGPAVSTVPEAPSSSEQQPLMHAWQLLVPTSPGSGHEGEGEGGPNSKGSLSVRRSLRSMLSGSSRLSRVSSHRDEEPATERSKETDAGDDGASTPGMVSPAACIAAIDDALDAPGHAANGAATVHGGDIGQQPLGTGPSQVAYCDVKAPHTGVDGPIDANVDAVVPAQHDAVGVDISQGASASPFKSIDGEPVRHVEEVEDEELTPAWKVAAAAAVAEAGADTNSFAAAERSSLGVRRSLRSMQVASTGSRLKRSSSHSTLSQSAAALPDAPFYGDLAATPSCVGEPLPGAAPSAAIQTSGSCTSPASGVVLPAEGYGSGDEQQVSPAWKVKAMPASAGDSPDVATATSSVPLGSQPSFRSSRAGSSRLRRASAPDCDDLHSADMAGDKGAVGDDAEVAAFEQEDPRDSAAAETVLTAAISGGPTLTGDVIETGAILSLGRARFPTCQGDNASDGAVGSRVRQAAGSSHSADGWTQPPLLRGGSVGRVGSLTNGHSFRHADVGGGGAGSPTRAGTSENGSMAGAWVARLSSRRLNPDAVGSVPLPRRSNSGGDPNVDAMRPAWQILPLPMSPGSPSGSIDGTGTGYFSASGGAGITSPGTTPSAANILASMRSNSRLSRMSSGIPEDLLAELRLQAHAAVGHLQGSAHDEDSGGGWADMNSSMEQSATHERLPLDTAVPTADGQVAATTAAGDGAGGTLHAWKVLPLRATAPTSSGLALGDGHRAQAAGAVPMTVPRVLSGGRAIIPTSRTGSHSSRLAVASTKPTILQVSFGPTSPSASSPKAEALPEVSEEEEEVEDEPSSAVSTPSGVSTPSAKAKATPAAGDGEDSSAVLHAWKLVPPSPGVSASASASTTSPGGGMAAATTGLATVHEGNNCVAAFTIVTPQRSHPTLGSRPSLKSLGSVRGSRLSRTSLGVEDYVDESYTDTPAAAGPGDSDDVESGDSAIESTGITEPRQHSADRIAPANEANQNAVAAAAAAAAAAVAVADNAGDSVLLHGTVAAEAEPPQLSLRSASERSSAPAAIGGMPQGVLYAVDALDSRPGSGALKFVASRSTPNHRMGDFPHDDDMAFEEGVPVTESPIVRALNSRPSMRSSRSSNSSRLSRVSSARDGGAALLADIREEDGEGYTRSVGGASDVAGASAGVHPETLAREERLPTTEPFIGSQGVLSAAEYDADDIGGAGADSPSGLELLGSRLSPTGGAGMRSGRSGSSRLSRMTSQMSEAGLEDIKEEGVDAAAGGQEAVGSVWASPVVADEGCDSSAVVMERGSSMRAPPPAPSAGAARIGSPVSSGVPGPLVGLRSAQLGPATAPWTSAPEEGAEACPLLPAWKVLLPAGIGNASPNAREADFPERTSPSASPGASRQPVLRSQRSSSLGNSRLRRVTSGVDEEPEDVVEDGSDPAAAAVAAIPGRRNAASASGTALADVTLASKGVILRSGQVHAIPGVDSKDTTHDDNLTFANLASGRLDNSPPSNSVPVSAPMGSRDFSDFSGSQPHATAAVPATTQSPLVASGMISEEEPSPWSGIPQSPAPAESSPQKVLQVADGSQPSRPAHQRQVATDSGANSDAGVETGAKSFQSPRTPQTPTRKGRGLFSCLVCFSAPEISE
ncbi:hypothetical protein VaNZ11_012304 [Volvox africanus]|uniref:Uncharacterized protein n=1 Tax=Volvox africanus TaxID=51714 RepID=A0ABQ5SET8_9CHLO|nr:hypothetical protein VaNZ11_012304 [Volvox africanus]